LEVLLTITFGTLTQSRTVFKLSGCYIARTNFLSKQDT